jgi:hypothetical protein
MTLYKIMALMLACTSLLPDGFGVESSIPETKSYQLKGTFPILPTAKSPTNLGELATKALFDDIDDVADRKRIYDMPYNDESFVKAAAELYENIVESQKNIRMTNHQMVFNLH